DVDGGRSGAGLSTRHARRCRGGEGSHLHLVAYRSRALEQRRRRPRDRRPAQRPTPLRNHQARHHPRRVARCRDADDYHPWSAAMTEPRETYSPERRTALLFTGTGADGAYHAGALRALDESGVKIDIVGGRGIGALTAVLSAVDGGAQLWESNGFWRDQKVVRLYRWRWPFRLLRVLAVAIAAVMIAPVVLVAAGLVFYPIALALGMIGLTAGAELVQALLDVLAALFRPAALPTWVPRL